MSAVHPVVLSTLLPDRQAKFTNFLLHTVYEKQLFYNQHIVHLCNCMVIKLTYEVKFKEELFKQNVIDCN
jgi:hypothetical protein